MAEPDEKTYPSSSFNGEPIPIEVARPIGTLYASTLSAWSADLAIPAGAEIVTVSGLSYPSWLHFGDAEPAIAADVLLDNVVYVPIGVFKTYAIPDGATVFQVKRYGANNGIIIMEFIVAWKATGIPGKFTRA